MARPVEESNKNEQPETGAGSKEELSYFEPVRAADVITSAEQESRVATNRILDDLPSNDILSVQAIERAAAQRNQLVPEPRIKVLFPKENLPYRDNYHPKKSIPDFRQPSGLKKFGKEATGGLVRVAEKTLTGMKKLIGPYYSSRRDFLDALQFKLRDKNWAEAKERGHGWIPKWFCGWVAPEGIANYTGKVLDWLGGPLTKKAWHLRQGMGNGLKQVTEKPRRAIVGGAKSLVKKVGKFFLGAEQQKKSRMKRKKNISKLRKGISKLDSWMHRPVKFGKKRR